MYKTIIKIDNTKVEKYKFHQHKSLNLSKNIHFDKIVISNKVPFGKQDFKHFIGYKDAKIYYFMLIPSKSKYV